LNRPWDLLNDPHMSQKMVRSDFNGLELSMPPIPIEGAKSGKYPLLGEDTEEILAELGYKKDEIEYFKKEKLV
jgi:crotonobetainyl-CoA:carnitine CoA-transferase CaiB-like acyl-CoA transferase